MAYKKKIKKNQNKSGLTQIAKLTSKSISGVFINFKKNKEQKKIKAIKLHKLEEKNQVFKEKKELKIWEDRLNKESNKIKLIDDELRVKEKEIKSKEEKQINESERLIKKDGYLTQVSKE